MQLRYSRHGGSWRRRSLIEDAKFETVTNIEFEKRERTLSGNRGSISEEEEVFVQNGDVSSPVEIGPRIKFSIMLTLKEGIASLSRVIRVFENAKVTLEHIESRRSQKNDSQLDVLIECTGIRDKVTSLTNQLRQNTPILDLNVVSDQFPTWFPRHISELDNCTHLVTKFEPELDSDHPGFTDMNYRARRKQIADIAFNYKQKHVYTNLKVLIPTHACREFRENLEILEKEGGYSEHNIPQLDDVSKFLKKRTGFQLRPVSGLLSARDFLASLAFRVFQCTQYVRHGSKPDHSPEPDCVHELLGHVPMLADPKFAKFSQDIGIATLGASDEDIEKFATLYWFTVEFGLVKQDGGIRAYGAGVLSSYGELKHALSDAPKKLNFNPDTTAVQVYTDEDLQPIYFIVESFEDMQQKMRQYASKIKRKEELRYDPFTQTLQTLDKVCTMESLEMSLRSDLESLQRAVSKMQMLQT
ncbi:hypothetical protein KUTeg_006909, partial [Tegillarca granosa]